ncbi:hypothetical protein FB45DRAFT_870569 [Roridomyces roridus]|uniref:PHD-type domain-containing protein n=1 Tax=Roridomyces roridus TaxID=1738132 RepID=A0AAD7BIP7_9AGAR|nr:hypothetical protein FB45DRAFT_870569 [Roridomyces roridus]
MPLLIMSTTSTIVIGLLLCLLAATNMDKIVQLYLWLYPVLSRWLTVWTVLTFHTLVLLFLTFVVLNLLVVVHNLQVHRPGQAQRTRLTPYYAEDRTTLLGYVREEEDVLAAKTCIGNIGPGFGHPSQSSCLCCFTPGRHCEQRQHPTRLAQEHLRRMKVNGRHNWASTKRRVETEEYEGDIPDGEEDPFVFNVTDTLSFRRDFVDLAVSDEESSSESTDTESLDAILLDAVAQQSILEHSNEQRSKNVVFSDSDSDSDSTDTEVTPINCFGCGQIENAEEDESRLVQCESCEFWSHIQCQPEEGVDWDDPDVRYRCRRCTPRPAEQLFFRREIVVLPDPRVGNPWKADVKWYPARFVRHRPGKADAEFVFRFLDCVDLAPQGPDEWVPLPKSYGRSCAFCEKVLKRTLQPDQIGVIFGEAHNTRDPSRDHPLISIFNNAVEPLGKLLMSFPDDHPVVQSYRSFFTADSEDHDETEIEHWLRRANLHDPVNELTALMKRPLKHLDDFRVVAVPDAAERRHRVLAVGRALLQILAIQHNLEEPLDLNGDAYEDLVNGHIESLSMDGGEAFRAMYMATKPKLLSHAKFWDRAAFVEECGEFIISHELNDGTYRPATYGR